MCVFGTYFILQRFAILQQWRPVSLRHLYLALRVNSECCLACAEHASLLGVVSKLIYSPRMRCVHEKLVAIPVHIFFFLLFNTWFPNIPPLEARLQCLLRESGTVFVSAFLVLWLLF